MFNSFEPWFCPPLFACPALEFLPLCCCCSPGFREAPRTLGSERASDPRDPDFPRLFFLCRPSLEVALVVCCCCGCCPLIWVVVVVVVVVTAWVKWCGGKWSPALNTSSSSWKALSKAFSVKRKIETNKIISQFELRMISKQGKSPESSRIWHKCKKELVI